jgi:hypothetical protein
MKGYSSPLIWLKVKADSVKWKMSRYNWLLKQKVDRPGQNKAKKKAKRTMHPSLPASCCWWDEMVIRFAKCFVSRGRLHCKKGYWFSRLGTGKPLTFFTVYCGHFCFAVGHLHKTVVLGRKRASASEFPWVNVILRMWRPFLHTAYTRVHKTNGSAMFYFKWNNLMFQVNYNIAHSSNLVTASLYKIVKSKRAAEERTSYWDRKISSLFIFYVYL